MRDGIYLIIIKVKHLEPWSAYLDIENHLLCVSCPSVTVFSAILFLLFDRSSSNSSRSLESFRRTQVQNFIKIRQRVNDSPQTPIVKNARFRQRYNVAESGQLLQLGSMGKFFTRCRICMKIISPRSFALRHETHNRHIWFFIQ